MDSFKYYGSIVRIKLENFMSYDTLEFLPGPNVNMVLGVNGTGKSAIVCSIIIGLAGDPSLTGRSSSLASYVKKGRTQASVLVELFNRSGRNFIIERKITISKNRMEHKSEWKLNGMPAKKIDIQELGKKYNVKVDNLCQLLPQDSVALFAKMNYIELSHNTFKTLGNSSIVDGQQKLVDDTKLVAECKRKLQVMKADCAVGEVNVDRLQGEVKQFTQRRALVKKKKICERKKHYIRFKKLKDMEAEAKKKLTEKREERKKIEKQNEPMKRLIESNKTKLESLKATISKQRFSSFRQLFEKNIQKIDDIKVACSSDFAYFVQKEKEQLERASEIDTLKKEVEGMEVRYAESQNTDWSVAIKATNEEMDVRKDSIRDISLNKDNISSSIQNKLMTLDELKREASAIKSVEEKRFLLLRQNFPKVWKVYEWLLQNRSRFKRNIYAPMMCEINIKDIKYAKVVENAISKNDLSAFVCEDGDDLKNFTRWVRDEFKMTVNVILSVPEDSDIGFVGGDNLDSSISSLTATPRSQRLSQRMSTGQNLPPPIDQLKQYGVIAYLSELIEAPKPILQYLCKALNFNRIPYADNCTETKLKFLLDTFNQVYVGSDFYASSTSRYDKKKVTTSDKVRDANLLRFWFDKKRYDEVQTRYAKVLKERDEMNQKLESLDKELDKIRAEWQSIKEKLTDLKAKQNEKEKLKRLLDIRREQLQKLESSEIIDIQEERRKLQEKIAKKNVECINCLKDIQQILSDRQLEKESFLKHKISLEIAEVNYKVSKKLFEDSLQSTTRLNEECSFLDAELKRLESKLKDLKRVTAEKVKGFSAQTGQLTAACQKEFNDIEAETIEELERMEAELDFQISRICHDKDSAVIEEFRKRQEELQEKRTEIESLNKELDVITARMNKLKESWVPKVQEIIQVIDKNYEEYMKKLEYGGRVSLDFDQEDPDDFSKYGIKIMVKFRDDVDLMPLSATRQSGGERSVATMIYMLALQTITTAPFRCLDEINQGMDATNERKVFELLVDIADKSSSQYFLISPKLLPDLPYSPKMKIHIVFNGNNVSKKALQSLVNNETEQEVSSTC